MQKLSAGMGRRWLQLDATRGQAESLFQKEEGCSISERSAMTKKLDENQAVLVDGFQKMSEFEKFALMKKIDVAYFVVKEEMAFTKYKEIFKLEERHSVQFNDVYRLDDACKMFVHATNDSIADEPKAK